MRFVQWMNGVAGRVARAAVGVALMIVGAVVGGGVGVVLAVVGLVPLAAGVFGVCLVAPLLRQPFRAR